MKKFIDVNGCAYAGAPCPPFDPYAINESKFDHEERYKDYEVTFDPDAGIYELEWVTQMSTTASKEFLDEVARAFSKNGCPTGTEIKVYYRCRDYSNWHTYLINAI